MYEAGCIILKKIIEFTIILKPGADHILVWDLLRESYSDEKYVNLPKWTIATCIRPHIILFDGLCHLKLALFSGTRCQDLPISEQG